MTERGTGASIARWAWSFDAGSEGVLVLRLSGRWLMDDHLPPRAAIERELRARPTARVLAFDTRGIEIWDSGFVVFVLARYGDDMPEITGWRWGQAAVASGRGSHRS